MDASARVRAILQEQMDAILGKGEIDAASITSDKDLEVLMRKLEDINPVKAAHAQEEIDQLDMDEVHSQTKKVLMVVEDMSMASGAMAIALALAALASMAKGLQPEYAVLGAIAAHGWREMGKQAKLFKQDQEKDQEHGEEEDCGNQEA
jgi:hypothetical protein